MKEKTNIRPTTENIFRSKIPTKKKCRKIWEDFFLIGVIRGSLKLIYWFRDGGGAWLLPLLWMREGFVAMACAKSEGENNLFKNAKSRLY